MDSDDIIDILDRADVECDKICDECDCLLTPRKRSKGNMPWLCKACVRFYNGEHDARLEWENELDTLTDCEEQW